MPLAKMTPAAEKSLNKVVQAFQQGNLSPVVQAAAIQQDSEDDKPCYHWSLRNRVLAYAQTGEWDCRNYRAWQRVNRQVKRKPDCKTAYIFAPAKIPVEDKSTGKRNWIHVGRYRPVAVFPYSGTDGEELPEFDYAPVELPPLMDAAERLGCTIAWAPLPPDRLAQINPKDYAIQVGTQTPAAFFHELAHAAHGKVKEAKGEKLKGGQNKKQETIAEFTAAVLMEMYGYKHTGNAWKYIRHYNKDPLEAIMQAVGEVEEVLALLLPALVKGESDE